MQIISISPTNFQSTTRLVKYYVPGKYDTTLRCFIEGSVEKPTRFKYDVLKNGKVIESKEFSNKRGFGVERFAAIIDQMQTKVREGFDFLYETMSAEIKGGN